MSFTRKPQQHRIDDFPEQTPHCLLARALNTDPDREVLQEGSRVLTVSGLEKRSQAIARGLSSIGVRRGSRVGLLLSSAETFVLSWFGVLRVGGILVPINAELKHRQLRHVIEHSEMSHLVLDSQLVPALETLPADSKIELDGLVLTGRSSEQPQLARQLHCDEIFELEELTRRDGSLVERSPDPREAAAILYTGGTTGPSKGVVCSQGQYYWWATLMARILKIGSGDIWFTCLPFFHINAQATFLATLKGGGKTSTEGRFSASGYWQQVRNSGATVASLLGTMAYILFKSNPPSPDDKDHKLKAVFCPGVSAAIKPAFEERFGIPVVNAYGMTELNCLSATPLRGSTPPASMGKPLPEFEIAVVDANDEPVADGERGEFVVRPQRPFSVMSRYHRMSEETLESWQNLWFHTGDRGYQDGEGNLYFVERLKDCIRRRGENISSQEIESVVTAHPAVLEAAAYPVPAEIGEEDVMVSLVLRPGQSLRMEELILWCDARLARFAVPRYVRIASELPKTAVGRIQKFTLRGDGITPDTWDREQSGPLGEV